MRKVWLGARSTALWAVSGIHFALACFILIVMAIFIDPEEKRLAAAIFLQKCDPAGGSEIARAAVGGIRSGADVVFWCRIT